MGNGKSKLQTLKMAPGCLLLSPQLCSCDFSAAATLQAANTGIKGPSLFQSPHWMQSWSLVKYTEPEFGNPAILGSLAGDCKQTNFTEHWPTWQQMLFILHRMFVS